MRSVYSAKKSVSILVTTLYVFNVKCTHQLKTDSGYPLDSHADKNPYPHDHRADKDSYPHDSSNQCIILDHPKVTAILRDD